MSTAVRRDGRRTQQPPYLATQHRRAPSGRQSPQPVNSDFVAFLHKLLDLAFTPITYPLGVLRNVVTSPLTISVALKGILMVVLLLASAAFSILAVGAFWWSWGTGGAVEVEGWLVYGARSHRTPHAQLALPLDRFQEDLPYDVQVEFELVRPSRGSEEMGADDATGNFMVTLELRSLRAPEVAIVRASQPSLPPPPLPSSLLTIPSFPTYLIPPCIIPWPFRSFCPGRILGYSGVPDARIKERRRRGSFVSPAKGKEVVLLTKELVEGTIIYPGRGDLGVGSIFVSIGREDTLPEDRGAFHREVRTTGWVVIRFIPHPTGVRRLLTSHPIPPLLILPPLSLTLTLSSALIGFLVISCCGFGRKPTRTDKTRLSPRISPRPQVSPTTASSPEKRTSFANLPPSAGRDFGQPWEQIESLGRPPVVAAPESSRSLTLSEDTLTETGTNAETTGSITEETGETPETETGDSSSWESS